MISLTMAKTSPAEFVRQVRQEVSKVSWPTRKEAMITTIMVFIMASVMSIFFLGVDQLWSFVVGLLLGLGA
ncbi:preprotein translocase subunit SecE [Emcibacteraceae bacterium]|nr:preprotein translocase subunit SecE [Emcibacteraceae bacterium]